MTHVSNRFLIVHRDLLCGQALTEAVSALSRLSACEPVTTPVDALARVQQQTPDVVLVDWDLPAADAAALVRHVLQLQPAPRVIVFGVDVGDVFTPRDCCVIRRNQGMTQLLAHLTIPGHPTAEPPTDGPSGRPGGGLTDSLAGLTTRQKQILDLIDRNYSNKQIAATLGISLHTVKNHVHGLLTKLNVETRHAAADVLLFHSRPPAPVSTPTQNGTA